MHHGDPNEIAVEERGREGEGEEEGVVGGREPHGLDPPEPDPMLILGSLVDTLRMAGLRANPRHV